MGLTILNAIAILALNTLAVSAQAYSCECDGLVPVDWDDCATIANTLDGSPLTYTAGSDEQPCIFLNPPSDTDPDTLNCVITYCKKDGVADGESILYSDILLWYTSVASNCKTSDGAPGGECGPTGPATNNRKVSVHAQANPAHGNTTLVWATPPEEAKREHARDFPDVDLGT